LGIAHGTPSPLLVTQHHCQCVDDLTGDLVLQCEHVDQIAIIALGPVMSAGGGVDELRVDAHRVAAIP